MAFIIFYMRNIFLYSLYIHFLSLKIKVDLHVILLCAFI